jgi:hypothetical protein
MERPFKTPVMMAALSHLNNVWPDGMVEMARGAKAAGRRSTGQEWATRLKLERITATGARTIKIIKP